ncbi:Nucleolar protein 7, partial [Galemys pyrenaicus]
MRVRPRDRYAAYAQLCGTSEPAGGGRSASPLFPRGAPRARCFRVRGQTLRPRASRAPASASAMVDEGQPSSEEEAEHGLLLGLPSSGAAAEPLEDEEGDGESDDEAPEELTFASAQAEAREEEKRVRETLRRDKTLLKEKRKRREELFIEQKVRPLLSVLFLKRLGANIKKSPGKLKEVDLQKKKECEKGSDSKKTKEKVQKVQSVGQNKSYLAVRLKDQDLRDSRKEAAKAFIQNSLYGPGTNRTTVNKFLSLENKRLPVKKAAAQFLNNSWGTQKKQNAKRFKKRWMFRKMKTSK